MPRNISRDHEIPWAPIRRIIKSQGVEMMQRVVPKFMAEYLEDHLKRVVENAKMIMIKEGRKTLYKEDLKLADKLMNR